MRPLLIAGLSVLLLSCGTPTPLPQPPAAPQSLDLTFARALLSAQAAIDQARPMAAADAAVKPLYNKIVLLYNAAEAAYLEYHQAVAAGSVPDSSQIKQQIATLTANTAALLTLVGVSQ